jgi:rhamnosyltransferase
MSLPMASPPLIVAVVVTYNPDLPRLAQQLAALQSQVQQIVLVDNGSSQNMVNWVQQLTGAWPTPWVLSLAENRGIAAAQNHGVAWARTQAASHILLMDHDSLPAPDMVSHLLHTLQQRADAGAVGPWHADPRRTHASKPFVRIEGLAMRRLVCSDADTLLSVDHLIASGCLIPIAVLDRIGPFREDFFIDFVDVEWCLRARHAGYALYGVCAARLEHSLGDAPVRFLGREYLSHAPWRHYYHVRNALLLYREPWVPLNWKLVSAWRLVLKMGFQVLVPASRWQHLGQIAQGIWHGLLGLAGAHPRR